MPIVLPDGSFFGTLCAIDPRPARLNTPETVGMFKLFAELIAFHYDAASRLAASQASLLDERTASELREQFIAVLGHDLRNPLAAIDGGITLLERQPLPRAAQGLVEMMQKSARRMSGLIDNVLDFARGRLGGGLTLQRRADVALQPMLAQVVAELRTAMPDRRIIEDYSLTHPVDCDLDRIAQLVSNLVANALTYGAADRPVQVRAVTRQVVTGAAELEISVANAGDPIAPDALARLFQPFARGTVRPSQQGLGLGLYIAAEVARAHGGTLEAASTAEETRFTFRMPITADP